MARAGIALGSNLGDRMAYLQSACDHLREIADDSDVFLTAPVYQSVPSDCPPDSPDFLNTVVEFEFQGSPESLLEKTQAIQAKMGRDEKSERNAPRVIDLDILYLSEAVVKGTVLELPHPRMTERRFVLKPLVDICPDLVLPDQVVTVAELLALLPHDDLPLVAMDDGLN